MFAVITTSDTVTAILLGVPGTAAAQATVLDGYPMALRGEAARALGASFTSSCVGGVLGAVLLAMSMHWQCCLGPKQAWCEARGHQAV